MKFRHITCVCLITAGSYALDLNDFVSNLVDPQQKVESKETNPDIAFKIPADSKKRNAAESSLLSYCDKVYSSNCSKQASSQVVSRNLADSSPAANPYVYQGANDQYVNRNSNTYDKNAIANFNITNSNQTALQAYSPRLNNYTTEDKLMNNVAIPLKPDKNTSVSVSPNQVQFNMSY